MKYYSKLLTLLLLFVVMFAKAEFNVGFYGPYKDFLRGGAEQVTVTTIKGGVTTNVTTLASNANLVDVTIPDDADQVTYTVIHKNNYVYRAQKSAEFNGPGAPAIDLGAPTTTTINDVSDPFNGYYKSEYTIAKAKLKEAYVVGFSLIQQYSFEVLAPQGQTISFTRPNGPNDADPFTLTGAAGGSTETVRINKDGNLADLEATGFWVTNPANTERTIFNKWADANSTTVFGFAENPFVITKYAPQELKLFATGTALATGAKLTMSTEEQIKIILKAPQTRTIAGDLTIGGNFGKFNYNGAPLSDNADFSIADRNYNDSTVNTFTTDQFVWVKKIMVGPNAGKGELKNVVPTVATVADDASRFMFYDWLFNGVTQLNPITLTSDFIVAPGTELTPVFVRQYKTVLTTLPDFEIKGKYFSTENNRNVSNHDERDLTVISTSATDPSDMAIYVDYYTAQSPTTPVHLLKNLKVEGVNSNAGFAGFRNAYLKNDNTWRKVATLWDGSITTQPTSTGDGESILVDGPGKTLSFKIAEQYLLTIGKQTLGTIGGNLMGAAYGTNPQDNNTNAALTVNLVNQSVDTKYWMEKDKETTNLAVTNVTAGNIFVGWDGTIYGAHKASIDTDDKFTNTLSGDLLAKIVPIRKLTINRPASGKVIVNYHYGLEIKESAISKGDANSTLVLSVNDTCDVKLTYERIEDTTDPTTERYFFKTFTANPNTVDLSGAAIDLEGTAVKGFKIDRDVVVSTDLYHQFKLNVKDAADATATAFTNGTMVMSYMGTTKNENLFTSVLISNAPLVPQDYVWVEYSATAPTEIVATPNSSASTPNPKYKFENWTGTTAAVNTPTSGFVMNKTYDLGVKFTETYSLKVDCPTNAEKISLTSYKDGHETKTLDVLKGANATIDVNVGSTVSHTITQITTGDTQSSLNTWQLKDVTPEQDPVVEFANPKALSTTFVMPEASATLTAKLNVLHKVTVKNYTGNGTLKVEYKKGNTDQTASVTSGTQTIWVDADTYPTITATPNASYGVANWADDLVAFDAMQLVINPTAESTEFKVDAPKTIGVRFERQVRLTVNIPDDGAYFKVRYFAGGVWRDRIVAYDADDANNNGAITESKKNTFNVSEGSQAVISAYTYNNASFSNTIDFVEWTGALTGDKAESGAAFGRQLTAEPPLTVWDGLNWVTNPAHTAWVTYRDVLGKANWSGFDANGQNTIKMTEDRNVGAKFQTPTRKFSVNNVKNGMVHIQYTYANHLKDKFIDATTEEKFVLANAKSEFAFELLPATGYKVNQGVIDYIVNTIPNVKVTNVPNGSYQFLVPSLIDDFEFDAIFDPLFGELVIEPFNNGTLQVDYTIHGAPESKTILPTTAERILSVDFGTDVTFTPTADANYEFKSWNGNVTAGTAPIIAGTMTFAAKEAVGVNFGLISPAFTIAKPIGADNKIKVEYVQNGVPVSVIVNDNDAADLALNADVTSTVTMTAMPAATFDFVKWNGLELAPAEKVSFVMTEAHVGKTVSALFRTATQQVVVDAPANGTINVTYTGYNSNGVLTPDMAATIDAQSGTRVFDVVYGTNVKVEAIPATDYSFGAWMNAASGTTQDITINADARIYASFKNTDNSLTVNAAVDVNASNAVQGTTSVVYLAQGVTTPADVTNTAKAFNVDQATTVQLMAKANDGYDFIRWEGVPSDNTNPTISVVMDGVAKTITPIYRKQTRALTVNAPVNGAITVTYQGYTTAASVTAETIIETVNTQSGTRVFNAILGTDVTASATADRNYQLKEFVGFDNNTTPTLAVNGDETVGVVFETQKRDFTINPFEGKGKIKVEYVIDGGEAQQEFTDLTTATTITADFDSEVRVSVLDNTTDNHYRFANWTGSELGNSTARQASFVLNNGVGNAKQVGVKFEQITHKLTVEAPANGYITVSYKAYNTMKEIADFKTVMTPESGAMSFDAICLTDVTVTAEPLSADYSFVKWVNAPIAGVTDLTATVKMTQDYIIGSEFKLNTHTLTVNAVTNGKIKVEYFKGTVAVQDVVEGAQKTFTVDKSSEVKVQVIADKDYDFVRWTGDAIAEMNNKLTNGQFAMEGDATIGADFRIQTRKVTVEAPANGSFKVEYKGYKTTSELLGEMFTTVVNNESGTRTFDVLLNTNVALEATPVNDNYMFDKWTKAAAGTIATATVGAIVKDTLIAGRFTETPVVLTLNKPNNGKLYVEYIKNGIAKSTTSDAVASVEVDKSTAVKVVAVPDLNYDFFAWKDDLKGNTAVSNLTFTIEKATTIGADFRLQTRQVTVQAPINGSVKIEYTGYNTTSDITGEAKSGVIDARTGSLTFDVVHGTDIKLTATADLNYEFATWTGVTNLTANPTTEANIVTDRVITASFKLLTQNLTVAVPAHASVRVQYVKDGKEMAETITAGKSYVVDIDTQVRLEAFEATNYDFVRWDGTNFNDSKERAITFTMNADYVTIQPVVRIETRKLTAMSPVNGDYTFRYFAYANQEDVTGVEREIVMKNGEGARVFDAVMGQNVTAISRTAALNYENKAWTENFKNLADGTAIAVANDMAIGAVYHAERYLLTIEKPMNGKIKVEYMDRDTAKTKVVTDAEFKVLVDRASRVKLSATAAPDYDFVKWTNTQFDNNQNELVEFVMESAKTVGSLFRIETRTLTATSPVNGSYTFKYFAYTDELSDRTTEMEVTMKSGEGAREFQAVMEQNVTAVSRTADLNFINNAWEKDFVIAGNTNGQQIAMPETGLSIGASYITEKYNLMIEKPANGAIKVEYFDRKKAVTVVIDNATADAARTLTVDRATNVKITAMAAENYDFVMWKGQDNQFANVKAETVEFVMEADKTIGSYFRIETRKLSAQTPVNGSYSFSYYAYPSDNSKAGEVELRTIFMPANTGLREFDVVMGTNVTAIDRTPSTNYEDKAWTEAFAGVADNTSKVLNEPMTIGAEFQTIKHNLKVTAPVNGKVTVDYMIEGEPKTVTVDAGAIDVKVDQASVVNMKAIANDNYDFVIWKGDSQFEKMDATAIQFVMSNAKTVNTLFRKETRKLTAMSPINGEYTFTYVGYSNDNADATTTRTIRLTPYSGVREVDAILDTDVKATAYKPYVNHKKGDWIGFGDNVEKESLPIVKIVDHLTIGTLFELNNRNLEIIKPVNGKVKVEYIEGGAVKSIIIENATADADRMLTVDWATNVKVTALPNEFYDFLTWKRGGMDEITTSHVEFMMESQGAVKEVEAIFRLQTRTLTVTNPKNGKVKVTYEYRKEEGQPNKEVIVENTSKIVTFDVDVNSNVTIVPIPDVPGYLWNNNIVNDVVINSNPNANAPADGTATFKMDNAKVLVVNFKAEEYTITFKTNNGYRLNVNNEKVYGDYTVKYTVENEVIFENLQRDPYFEFLGWFDNAACTGTRIEKRGPDATGDMTYFAKWERTPEDLSIGRMWSHTLIVKNPSQDPLITNATFKWFDENGNLLDNGGKQYVTFSDKSVPNGTYKVEIYLNVTAKDALDSKPIVLTTSIIDAALRVFPTTLRAGEGVTIETGLMDNSNFKVGLFTQAGNPVQTQVVETENGLRINSIERSGMYVVRVTTADGNVESFKIVVSD